MSRSLMERAVIFILLVLRLYADCFSQVSAERIKKNRDNTLKEIDYANKLLLETQNKTKTSINEINLINHKLVKRKEYLLGMELEVNILNSAIDDNSKSVSLIQNEINMLKKVYARLIENLHRNQNSNYLVMYFFAAKNLNQLYRRIRIIKIYKSYLKSRRSKLEVLKEELIRKNLELDKLRNEKDKIIRSFVRESEIYQLEINEKKSLVEKLRKEQINIENEIKEKERTAKKLENELRRLVEEERRRNKSMGRREFLTPEERVISNDFESNVGRLPWPTEKGIITGKYGEHKHPDYKFVTIRNDGIYITTSKDEAARTICKGVVSRIFTIAGENQTVIIKHGEYYTLYHNLINVKVRKGQVVNTKEAIGTVFTNEKTKETVLYFQVWKGTEKEDPELWLTN